MGRLQQVVMNRDNDDLEGGSEEEHARQSVVELIVEIDIVRLYRLYNRCRSVRDFGIAAVPAPPPAKSICSHIVPPQQKIYLLSLPSTVCHMPQNPS